MTSAAYRFTATALPGGIVTFGLMLFMVALVATTYQDPPQDPRPIPLSAIFMTAPVPDAFPKPEKPVRNTDIVERPPVTRVMDPSPGGVDVSGPPITFVTETPVITRTITDSNYIPVYVPQPRFPNRAVERGVSGYAVVEVTITTSGAVRTPTVLEENPQGYGFGKAALQAAERLKYSPKMVDGQPVEVPGVKYKFSFSMEE